MIVVGGAVIAALAAVVAQVTSDRRGGAERVWDPAHGHYHVNGRRCPNVVRVDCDRASISSRAESRRSSSCLACSSVVLATPRRGTSIGSPTTSATVLNGFGICVRSQLRSVQCDDASR